MELRGPSAERLRYLPFNRLQQLIVLHAKLGNKDLLVCIHENSQIASH
jgi:hypothetical protein